MLTYFKSKTGNSSEGFSPFEPYTTKLPILFLSPVIVLHVPEMITTALLVSMPFDEILFIFQLQGNGKYNKQFLYNLLMDTFREILNGCPMLLHDFRLRSVGVLRDKLRNVVYLEVVLDSGNEVTDACWFPAVVVTGFQSGSVRLLLGIRKGED